MYQAFLQEQLRRIELAMKLNEEILKELRTKTSHRNKSQSGESEVESVGGGGDVVISGGGGVGVGVGVGSMSRSRGSRQRVLYIPVSPSPYFVDPLGSRPPDNEDTKRLHSYLSSLPRYMQPKKWTSSELNSLVQAVRQQCQQILVNQLYERYRHPDAGSLEDFNREMARIRNMSEYELEVYVNGIDWELVARTCLPHRTAEECRLKWLRHTSPLINRSAWSPEEDTALLQLVQCHGATHWEFIAQQLGTRRTPAQCFMRFQRSLNNKIVNSKWTEDEDRLLIQAVKKYGEKNWQQVANMLMNRTGQQALHRWHNTLSPNIKRGKWELVEDLYLTLSVQAYRQYHKWTKIQRHVPGRTDVQCRERWMNVLDPTLKVGSWTKDEDAALLASVQRHGPGNWCLVAQDLAPRTDNQCWRRWKRLVGEHNVEAYRSSTRQRKAIVPPNFQGRAKERPIALIQDITLSQKFHESPTTHSPSLTLTTNNNNKKKDHQENFKPMRKRRRVSPSQGQNYNPNPNEEHIILEQHRSEHQKSDTQMISLFNSTEQSSECVPTTTFTVDRDVNVVCEEPQLSSSSSSFLSGFTESKETPEREDVPHEVIQPHLPLVLPSPVTFQAFYNLLRTLDSAPLPDNDAELLDNLLEYTNTPEFKLLAAWFNSLFLYPYLLAKELHFVR